MDFVRDLNMLGTDTHDYAPNLNMVGTATLEQMSSTLANQTTDQDRYALAETIISAQVTQRDKLLVEERAMVEEIRELKAQIAASRMDTAPDKSLDPSKFILQIPDIRENYKEHLDFGKVELLSNRSSLEYKGRILKPQERADLIDKIVESRERYPVRNYADMRKTMDSLQQQFLTNSLYACSNILTSENEGMELYTTWNNGWEKLSETDKDAQDAKLQSSTILEEILRRIFSKDNPAFALQIQHARTRVPEDLLGVYALHIVREHFPQATLDVIVRDIIKVLMFSLQAPKCATFEEWHRKLQKSIEDLNLLYGAISWDQIYLAIVVWALELMEDKYRQLRQHMKFNLPGTTKALLENPIDTLDQIIRMVTKWDGTQVTPQMRNAMVRRSDLGSDTRTLHIVTELLDIPMIQQDVVNATAYSATSETICSYCKQKNHTIEMCVNKKFDRRLKDKVSIIVSTLVENYETLNNLLQ